ncbi:glutamine amidotransferase-related protein [Rahnella variigena]|uniref:CTP synthase (glutamine hydrolyzing) n=1 Tax=Rahnella variigena TaxID=574964 RepID=A0ABX9PZL5_9GAMM|nr:glutamine amidotransferase [Rahnella variigena]RJT51311.1 glutamine amidotransferase [Rahnella variigena]RKF70516.1 glutamine amidotransferase [Rahnella variigena]
MTITFIAHSTPEPALYGAMAAILAELRALPLCHFPVSHDAQRYPNARQHVTAQGHALTSGLVWLERLTGRGAGEETGLESLIYRALKEDIVVPLREPLSAGLAAQIAEHGIETESLTVARNQDKFQLEDCATGKIRSNGWGRDAFGRWALGSVSQPVMRAGKTLRVALVGDFAEQRDSYPAMLAALGDAADALAMNIDVVYVTAALLGSQLDCTLFDVDGIILPGATLTQGDHQASALATAAWALENRTPVLGINQGMHQMVTALGQKVLGQDRVVMHGPSTLGSLQTGLPLAEHAQPRPGNHTVITRTGSLLANKMGDAFTLRYNQRRYLNPHLLAELESTGLRITGYDESGEQAQVAELDNHPFFLGVQGQPELMSRRERPHPLLMAFLQQVRQGNRDRDVSHAALTQSVRLKHPHLLMG